MTDHEVIALAGFGHDNDLHGLLVLADAMDEDDRPNYALMLRTVATENNPAIRFFFAHAGPAWNPDIETHGEGRMRTACKMAFAEAELLANVGNKKWRVYWIGFLMEENWACTLCQWDTSRNVPTWTVMDSLMGIELEPVTLDDGLGTQHREFGYAMFDEEGDREEFAEQCSPYCRIVQADLADAFTTYPDWMNYLP